SHADSAELHVRARQTLSHRDQIRNHFPVIDREPLSSATETRHHFICDQKYAVLVAKRTQALHVTIRRNENTVRTDNRLDDQCGDRLWSFELQNFFRACEHVFSCVPTSLNAVIEIRNAKHSGNARLRSPATRIARECQRARGATVISAITRADLVASGV